MAGAEIEFVGDFDVRARGKLLPHLRRAGHQIAIGIVLVDECYGEIAALEAVLAAHDGAEELLLEGKPAHAAGNVFRPAPAPADFNRLFVPGLVEIELRVLALVLVILLHAGDGNVPVEVHGIDVSRNHLPHSLETQHVFDHILTFCQGIALLYVAASGEGKTERHAGVGLFRHLEIEVGGADVLAGIDGNRIVAPARLEDVEVGGIVIVVVLDLHAVRLRPPGGECEHYLVVLKGNDAALAPMHEVEGAVLVDFSGSLCDRNRRIGCGGVHDGGSIRGGDGIGYLPLDKGD